MALPAIVKRTELLHFMNTGTTETPTWKRMGDGWIKFDDSTSAKTDSTKYINMDTEITDTTGYTVSYAFEADLMYADPTIKHVYDIYKQRKILSECEVEILTVEKFNGTSGSYNAFKETVAIAPSGTSENNNKMKMSGNFNGKGDPVYGTAAVTVAEGVETVTFTPAASGSGT